MALTLQLPAYAARTGAAQHPFLAALQGGLQSLLHGPANALLDLLPPIILAVPKSKVSHSRKRMRAANKHLEEKFNINSCPACGRAKLAHHLCHNCYSQLSRGFKSEAKLAAKHAERTTPPTPSTSSTASSSSAPADQAWAQQRGGAQAIQPGQQLTKWMRARLGYAKADGKIRLGQEQDIAPKNPKRHARWQARTGQTARNNDQDNDDHQGGVPPNVQLA